MEKEDEGGSTEPPREVRAAGVELRVVGASLTVRREVGKDLEVHSEARSKHCCIFFHSGGDVVYEVKILRASEVYQADESVLLFRVPEGSAVASFTRGRDASLVLDHLNGHLLGEGSRGKPRSIFSLRTEEASAKQYFQFYGYLSQQQNMMQDYVRTSTYQTSILHNSADFKDKVVLDVGAGTGVLSFFALQGGAKKVYAVEASNMATYCAKLVKANNLSDRMQVLGGKIEEIEVLEEVDVIISEPMGYMLFNERMLETYLHAKKWLKPGGKMYPTQGILYVAPFSDEALYMEQMGKTYFWHQQSFHGIDVSALHVEAVEEYFKQPIVDTFDIRILMSRPIGHSTDFSKAQEQDLHKINIPLSFKSWTTGYMHGLAFWFDVAFIGSQATVWLSTAPFQPLTHWYQVRLLLQQPLFVQEGQELSGWVQMIANERQSYDISMTVMVVGTNLQSSGTYDLKNPNFRYMSAPQAPPGSHHTNPTETYFDAQSAAAGQAQPQKTASPQQVSVQSPPQVIRSPNERGYPLSHHSLGTLQTGTEVIPVVNGSIISPSVQQSNSPSDPSQPSSPHYTRYSRAQHAQGHHIAQSQHWVQPVGGGAQSMQNSQHSAPHQHGMGTAGGLVDLGMGTAQHTVVTPQYGTGMVQLPQGQSHANQYNLGSPSGSVLYQKWSPQSNMVLHNVASHS